jgi:hypothetical protein
MREKGDVTRVLGIHGYEQQRQSSRAVVRGRRMYLFVGGGREEERAAIKTSLALSAANAQRKDGKI